MGNTYNNEDNFDLLDESTNKNGAKIGAFIGVSVVFLIISVISIMAVHRNLKVARANAIENAKVQAKEAFEQEEAKALEEAKKAEEESKKQDVTLETPLDENGNAELSNGSKIHIDSDGNIYIYTNGPEVIYEDADGKPIKGSDKKSGKKGKQKKTSSVYGVKEGDTLAGVSGKTGQSVDSIAHYNEIDDVDLIYAGESLRIPDKD